MSYCLISVVKHDSLGSPPVKTSPGAVSCVPPPPFCSSSPAQPCSRPPLPLAPGSCRFVRVIDDARKVAKLTAEDSYYMRLTVIELRQWEEAKR